MSFNIKTTSFPLQVCTLRLVNYYENFAMITTCNVSRFDHITPTLKDLHWLPVKFRIDFKILLIVFKALHGLAPDYISELITIKPPSSYSMRSNSKLLLQKTTLKTLPTLGDRSFGCAAPNLWNDLPSHIQQADSIGSFKKLLKTHLFRKAYCNI